uniref:ATP synthase complex subunit 8 n=1 Tax=Pandion haliaetus TaxID=56262 RepID=A0EY39_PANHA|nr:ATP synthase F0 subunit 8 [Pandion haliaetus]ABG37776.1 ATP synthase subunit 8 [Pandion haliaetus]
MPQLNPNPWLLIMLMSWMTFTLIIQPKLLQLTQANTPTNKLVMTNTTPSWTWPWT